MIKMMKRNFRSLVFLLLIAVAAVGSFGALSSGGLAAGQSNKQSRAARKKTDSTNNQSSKATKKNRSCKQVCEDTFNDCLKTAGGGPSNPFGTDFGQPGGCTYVRDTCIQDCPSNRKQRKPQRLPKT